MTAAGRKAPAVPGWRARRGTGHGERQALVIVGESTLEQVVDKAGLKADQHVTQELNTSAKDIDKAVQEAATEVS